MADCVQGRHDDVRGCHLVCLHFDLRHLGLPWRPFPTDGHLHRDGAQSPRDPRACSQDTLSFTQVRINEKEKLLLPRGGETKYTSTVRLPQAEVNMATIRGRPRPRPTYLVINDGYVGCSGQGHGRDPSDVLAQLCSHFQPTVPRQGPENGINQIPLWEEEATHVLLFRQQSRHSRQCSP